MDEKLNLRPATMDDAAIILEWVNDPMDRANSFDSNPIELKEHLAWMECSLADPARLLYIMEDDGTPVGHIKLYLEEDRADVGYCIGPEFRGHGYASKMIGLLTDEPQVKDAGVKTIVASVKPENTASIRALEHNGYEERVRVFELEL